MSRRPGSPRPALRKNRLLLGRGPDRGPSGHDRLAALYVAAQFRSHRPTGRREAARSSLPHTSLKRQRRAGRSARVPLAPPALVRVRRQLRPTLAEPVAHNRYEFSTAASPHQRITALLAGTWGRSPWAKESRVISGGVVGVKSRAGEQNRSRNRWAAHGLIILYRHCGNFASIADISSPARNM